MNEPTAPHAPKEDEMDVEEDATRRTFGPTTTGASETPPAEPIAADDGAVEKVIAAADIRMTDLPAPTLPRPGGTVLIPSGLVRRDPSMIPEAESEPADGVDEGQPEHDLEITTGLGFVLPPTSLPPTFVPPPVPLRPYLPPPAFVPPPSLPPQPVLSPSGLAPPGLSPPGQQAGIPSLRPDDAAARRAAIEHRQRRRRATVLFVGLSVAILAMAVTLLIVVRSEESSGQRAGEEFRRAYDIVLDALTEANDRVTATMTDLRTAASLDLAALQTAAAASIEDLENLALPVSEGAFAEQSAILRDAVDAELSFFRTLGSITGVELADFDEGDAARLASAWEDASDALVEAVAGSPRAGRPAVDELALEIDQVGEILVAAAERENLDALLRLALTDYRARTVAVLDRYQALRDQLAAHQLRTRTVETSGDSADILGILDSASSARFQVADDLEAIGPLDQFVGLHAALVDSIREQASNVEGATDAVYEADCTYVNDPYYDYEVYEDVTCPALADTSAYAYYVSSSEATGANYDRLVADWYALHDTEYALVE